MNGQDHWFSIKSAIEYMLTRGSYIQKLAAFWWSGKFGVLDFFNPDQRQTIIDSLMHNIDIIGYGSEQIDNREDLWLSITGATCDAFDLFADVVSDPFTIFDGMPVTSFNHFIGLSRSNYFWDGYDGYHYPETDHQPYDYDWLIGSGFNFCEIIAHRGRSEIIDNYRNDIRDVAWEKIDIGVGPNEEYVSRWDLNWGQAGWWVYDHYLDETRFMPVKNLAEYWYGCFLNHDFGTNPYFPFPEISIDHFRVCKPLIYLGYTIHAIGDSTVPHHIHPQMGKGHREWENHLQELYSDKLKDGQESDLLDFDRVAQYLNTLNFYQVYRDLDSGNVRDFTQAIKYLVTETALKAEEICNYYEVNYGVPFHNSNLGTSTGARQRRKGKDLLNLSIASTVASMEQALWHKYALNRQFEDEFKYAVLALALLGLLPGYKARISNLSSEVQGDKAVVTWKTNQPCDSLVEYAHYGTVYPSGWPKVYSQEIVKEHRIEISNLTYGSHYYFKAFSTNVEGNKSASNLHSFYVPFRIAPSALAPTKLIKKHEIVYAEDIEAASPKTKIKLAAKAIFAESEELVLLSETFKKKITDTAVSIRYSNKYIKIENLSGEDIICGHLLKKIKKAELKSNLLSTIEKLKELVVAYVDRKVAKQKFSKQLTKLQKELTKHFAEIHKYLPVKRKQVFLDSEEKKIARSMKQLEAGKMKEIVHPNWGGFRFPTKKEYASRQLFKKYEQEKKKHFRKKTIFSWSLKLSFLEAMLQKEKDERKKLKLLTKIESSKKKLLDSITMR